MYDLGVKNFDKIYQPKGDNIVEIIKVASFFLKLVSDEDTKWMFEEILKDELITILDLFQKIERLGFDG